MIGTRLKDAPDDLQALAAELGISAKRLVRMKEKHGEKLLPMLQRRWWELQDRPRLLHRSSEFGYTDTPAISLGDEPEAVTKADQERITAESRVRNAERAEELAERATRKAVEELRQAQAKARKRGVAREALPHILKIQSEIEAIRQLAA